MALELGRWMEMRSREYGVNKIERLDILITYDLKWMIKICLK
jgi:hypothetical protein